MIIYRVDDVLIPHNLIYFKHIIDPTPHHANLVLIVCQFIGNDFGTFNFGLQQIVQIYGYGFLKFFILKYTTYIKPWTYLWSALNKIKRSAFNDNFNQNGASIHLSKKDFSWTKDIEKVFRRNLYGAKFQKFSFRKIKISAYL